MNKNNKFYSFVSYICVCVRISFEFNNTHSAYKNVSSGDADFIKTFLIENDIFFIDLCKLFFFVHQQWEHAVIYRKRMAMMTITIVSFDVVRDKLTKFVIH